MQQFDVLHYKLSYSVDPYIFMGMVANGFGLLACNMKSLPETAAV